MRPQFRSHLLPPLRYRAGRIKGCGDRLPNTFRVVRWVALGVSIAALVSACTRTPAVRLVTYQDLRWGFVLSHPDGWTKVEDPDGTAVRFVPPAYAAAAAEAPEFVAVFTLPSAQRWTDPEIRRQVFSLLTIEGVSGFQQDARTTTDVLWYKFEVTGISGGREWASVGAVAAGRRRAHIAVCAKPLDRWRAGQRECDEVVRGFQPGNLQR